MVIILFAGAMAANAMLREAFPEITPNAFSISVIYPGANVEEVEEGVSRKIEEAIDGLEGVKRYATFSAENLSTAQIEIEDRFSMSKARDLIENAIASISTFPNAAERPVITEAVRRSEVLVITLSGKMDERTRKEMAERMRDDLRSDPAISQVEISGVRDYEIFIEISEARLREYGLSFDQITEAVRRGSVNLAGGSLRTKRQQINIRTRGRKYSGDELGDIVVVSARDGESVKLSELAAIRDGFTDDPVVARFDGDSAVMIRLLKTPGEDTIAIAKAGYEYVARKSQTLPPGIHLNAWADGSQVIQDRLSITFRNGLLGLCFVIVSLWFFLNTRLSFWVALGIPVSLAGSLFIMWLSGMTLNSITLFGLVMVTGIVVDDAIVVGEAILLRRSHGDGPLRAAANGVMEVGLPVVAAVCTTIVAFMPMGFVSGVMGQFMGTMAVGVIAALSISLIEALFILPAHLQNLHLPSEAPEGNVLARIGRTCRATINKALDTVIEKWYPPLIRAALRYRYVALCCGFAIVSMTMGLGAGGHIKFTPFPNFDENQIQATVEFPLGTPAADTAQAIEKTERGLREFIATAEKEHGDHLVEHVYTIVGDSNAASTSGTHTGTVRVQLRHSNTRQIHSQDILVGWQQAVGDIPGTLSQSFSTVEGGPGGSPIEFWLQGSNTEHLRTVSQKIRERLQSYDGVYQIEDSFRPGKQEIVLDIKPEARNLGLTLDELASQVYAGFYGLEADRIQRGRDDVRIKIRYSLDERSAVAKLGSVRIRTKQGDEVPLHSVADVELGVGPAIIERSNSQRRIAVSAEVDENRANAQDILNNLRADFLPDLMKYYPDVKLSFEGAEQDVQESFQSLIALYPLAMLGIFVIIATIFRSYLQPIIIMFTVPFGLIGAIVVHVLVGWPVSMFSVFGMMALTGVVVNDAIVLIEAVNDQLAKRVPVFKAIEHGGRRRFRAILLTSISTIGALIPIIIEDDLSSQPLNPMALSVAAGVASATVLTLIYIPCLLAILNDFRCVIHWLRHRQWPNREDVEPARLRGASVFADEDH